VLGFGAAHGGRELVLALFQFFGQAIEARQGVFEGSYEGFGVELFGSGCARLAGGGDGAVGEGLDEVLDYEVFAL
jgi:hypothetical protein